MNFRTISLGLAFSLAATSASAGDVFRGHWHGQETSPIAIQIQAGRLIEMCNFRDCLGGKIRTERHGRSYMMTTGKRLWTFTRSREAEAYSAAYWERKDGSWRILAEAELAPDPQAERLKSSEN